MQHSYVWCVGRTIKGDHREDVHGPPVKPIDLKEKRNPTLASSAGACMHSKSRCCDRSSLGLTPSSPVSVFPNALPWLSWAAARIRSSREDETDSDVDLPEAKAVAPAPAHRYGSTSPIHKQHHLYLVLDDWNQGFSIYKLDLADGSEGGDLTLPPLVHRQATADRSWNFAATGSKIIAAGGIKREDGVTLVYDTEMTAGLSIVPCLPDAQCATRSPRMGCT